MSPYPHIKVRAFLCAALQDKFLEDWLRDFFSNGVLLNKFYQPLAFVRRCSPQLLDELLLGLQPLMFLSFQFRLTAELVNNFPSVYQDGAHNVNGSGMTVRGRSATTQATTGASSIKEKYLLRNQQRQQQQQELGTLFV